LGMVFLAFPPTIAYTLRSILHRTE